MLYKKIKLFYNNEWKNNTGILINIKTSYLLEYKTINFYIIKIKKVKNKDSSILFMSNEKLNENTNNKLVTLTWENINVYTPVQGNKLLAKIGISKLTEPKHIVKDVNGVAKPGSLMAIMVNNSISLKVIFKILI